MILNAVRKRKPGEETTCFGSPSIETAPDGALLAAHDFYFTSDVKSPPDAETPEPGTMIYRSEDGGVSWRQAAHVGAYWAAFFVIERAVYLIGCDRPFGDIVIFRSTDSGRTWSKAVDEHSGILFRGGEGKTAANFHMSPGTVLVHGSRVYKSIDDVADPDRRRGWRTMVISADMRSDLLDARSWIMSSAVLFDPDAKTFPKYWFPATHKDIPSCNEWLEGNMAAAPDGTICALLCMRVCPNPDHAPLFTLSADSRTLFFDPEHGYIRLPGGHHKFCIRRDGVSGLYLAMGNNNTMPEAYSQRNTLTLSVSPDLKNWMIVKTLIIDDSPISRERSLHEVGFQYPDFRIAGDDLVSLVRTAYDGSAYFHDANQITFHRLADFRRHLHIPGS
ncbi:MAG: sialidase family protein [Spirochaetota bacterium]